jgi:hypothetical protein
MTALPPLPPGVDAGKVLDALAVKAREDVEDYCDLMLMAEGKDVVPHGIHHLMQEALKVCKAAGKHLVMVLPPEHGKSSQIGKWLAWHLGHNLKMRVGLVSGDYDLAERNLLGLRKTLTSPLNAKVFPKLKPDVKASKSGGEWSKRRLYLAGNQDPSFEIFPLDGDCEGVRLDVIWLDDAVTRKCHRSEAERERAHSAIHGTWLSRVTRGGFCIFSNNVWHRADAIHQMTQSPSFMTLWVGYVETDYMYWRVHFPAEGWKFGESGTLKLWGVWDKKRLEDRRNEDRLVYKRLYGQKALLAEETRFPPADEWHVYGEEELPRPGDGERVVAFLDPAGGRGAKNEDYASIMTVLIDKQRQMYLLDVWMKRGVPQDQVAAIWAAHRNVKRMGYRGIDAVEIEMLPKEQLWLEEPIRRFQAEMKARGDEDWKLNWLVNHPREKKEARIERINNHVRNGWLKFPKDFRKWMLEGGERGEMWNAFVGQVEDFPFADHDDGPDALAGAVLLAEQRGPVRGRVEDEESLARRLVREGREAMRANVIGRRLRDGGWKKNVGKWGFVK